MATKVLVTGAGGFIGHHLVKHLRKLGFWVRGVDIKLPEYELSSANEFEVLDLRDGNNCLRACREVAYVYHLAADMGGIGYISGSHASIARNNSLMNLHMLEAAVSTKVQRFFFSSTACVYRLSLQKDPNVTSLSEDMAHPAEPEEGYGWEKLYMEKLCEYYREQFGLQTRVARFHNVYGPLGTFAGGREKAPAATCRKVALAKNQDSVEVWGDGNQTRSFMYVDDCVDGIHRILMSDYEKPLNLGRHDLISINDLFHLVARIAGKTITLRHDLTKPQGVRGRNSDNALIRSTLGWEPSTSMEEGLSNTYRWIASQLESRLPNASSPISPQLRPQRDMSPSRCAIIGLGKLGSPMAACFAARGHQVIGVDLDQSKVDAINAGRAPVRETDLVELLDQSMGRLRATRSIAEAVHASDLIFMIVPTPSNQNGEFAITYLQNACAEVGRALRDTETRKTVVITSTVMPGATNGPIRDILENSSGRIAGKDFGLCYSPEFIALGSVVRDFLNPDFYLIGQIDEMSGETLESFYRTISLNRAPVARMSLVDAEIAKISVNSFVTMKISFANTLARICECIPGANVDRVTQGIGLDSRIGPKYLKGAISFGGPCFPRDNIAFSRLAQRYGVEAELAKSTDSINRAQIDWLEMKVKECAAPPQSVAILGLSYKPDTEVIEESASITLVSRLLDLGFSVVVHDPMANLPGHLRERARTASSAEEAISLADVVVLTTPWKEYKSIGDAVLVLLERGGRFIDCWRTHALNVLIADSDGYIAGGVGPQVASALSEEVNETPLILAHRV